MKLMSFFSSPILACASLMLLFSSGCAVKNPLNIRANEPSIFLINQVEVGRGRYISVPLPQSKGPLEIAAVAEGYKKKTEFISPPFDGITVNFLFMISDRLDGLSSWAEPSKRVQEQLPYEQVASIVIDVLIEGVNNGKKTFRQQDRDEAILDAKRQAIEKAGIDISSVTMMENFELKKDFVETKSKAALLPGYQIIDKGYQQDGTYLVILSGKVKSTQLK